MEITEEQYQQIAPLFPVARRKPKLTNLEVLNAVLYLAEQGCQGRALPDASALGTPSICAGGAGTSRGC